MGTQEATHTVWREGEEGTHLTSFFATNLKLQRRLFDTDREDEFSGKSLQRGYCLALFGLAVVLSGLSFRDITTQQYVTAAAGLFVSLLFLLNIISMVSRSTSLFSPAATLLWVLALLVLSFVEGQEQAKYWLYPTLVVLPVLLRTPWAAAAGVLSGVIVWPILFQRFDTEIAFVICLSMLQSTLISGWVMSAVTAQSRRLKNMAITDPLTGAYNRRFFRAQAQQALNNWRRSEQKASLVLADVDYFKRINDKYGHASGDIALQGLVSIIKSRVREVDTVCRYGGEEFVILLQGANAVDAVKVAHEIRKNVETIRFEDGHNMTISSGVCDISRAEDLDHWLNLTDEALYLAKKNGRNRVELAPQSQPQVEVLIPDLAVPEWR